MLPLVGTPRETFLARLPAALRAPASRLPDLEARLGTLVEHAREQGRADAAQFVGHVASHLPEDADLPEALDALHTADLALAWACTVGDETAVTAFTERLSPAIRAAAARVLPDDRVEDHVSDILGRLLVAMAPSPPELVKYSGRGRLSKWVQTVTVRAAHSRARKKTEQPRDDVESLAERMLEAGDPELAALKRTYRAQFKDAFARALSELTPKRRNVLRLELLDRLTIDAIARLYDVHVATISRWRADTRQRLLATTRRIFQLDHAVDREEFESIMRLIGSQLDVSLPRLLDEDDAPSDPA